MIRTAVVTGGASGVGAAACAHLARAGHRVAVLDFGRDLAEQTAAGLRADGHTAVGIVVDVSDRSSVEAAYAEVRAEFGPIEIVVTSAGVASFAAFDEITAELWERTLAVNLTGTFHSVQAAIGDMVSAGWGRVVTISSAAGQGPSKRQTHYSASKAGVIGFTRSLAAEYAARGITANSVPPFAVDTPMLRAAQDDRGVPPTQYLVQAIPAGRLGTPDDIAAVVAFLCTDAAGYITGQVIAPNGGALM